MQPSTTPTLRAIGKEAVAVLFETLWPTRCAVCDAPGEKVLCDECASALEFVDMCMACPRCGAPFGRVQCTQCNDVSLASLGLDSLPVDGMSQVVLLDDSAHRIVTIYKDADERRLHLDMARMLARYISPDRVREGYVASYIPDTKAAMRRRGFDHAQEIAEATARIAGMKCMRLFARPESKDQRKLGRRERIANMESSIRVLGDVELPEAVLLIDDVRTTGSTMFGAAVALKKAGVSRVWALAFACAVD